MDFPRPVLPGTPVFTPVMKRWVPLLATAQNLASSGDQHRLYQKLASGADMGIQDVPLCEIMVRRVPLFDTAQNMPNSGDQQIPLQSLPSGGTTVLQLVPLDEIMTLLFDPSLFVSATAANSPS